jgi:hypothetical protein
MSRNTSLRITAVALGLGMGSFAIQSWSQGAPAGGYQMAPPSAPAPGTSQRGPSMREVFAATLAAVVQTTGVAAASAVSSGLNGAITGWLDKKQRRAGGGMTYYPAQPSSGYPGEQAGAPPPQNYPGTPGDSGAGYPSTGYPSTGYPDTGGGASNGYPSTGYPATPGSMPGATPGTDGTSTGYPSTGYPDTGGANNGYPSTGYPATGATPGATPGYPGPASTPGYPGTGAPGGYPGSVPGSDQLYAGFAYEVHALGAGGYAQPVDPATHAFRTGDRFKVVYRPSLPGQVNVYNINAAGQSTQIDSLSVAAGQLAELGPYEFANMKGNETLILSLSPCSTAALMTATRDIVKVPQGASPTAGSFELSQCGSAATRGLRAKTRDIRKVAVEGGTVFGLDPLSRGEITSGDVAPRQITISLQHQ